jgi:hypothetical protein
VGGGGGSAPTLPRDSLHLMWSSLTCTVAQQPTTCLWHARD